MTSQHFDAVVIGSGQGGTPLCQAFAAAGKRTALIEREHVGGTCINEGCTPTKTMIASGRVAYLARRGADYGVNTGAIAIDMTRVRQRKRDIVDSFRGGSERRILQTPSLRLIRGEASFAEPHVLQVRMTDGTAQELTSDLIFINAGCRPAVPTIDGLQNISYLNSTSIMELDRVPEHLLVLGGGYVGLEFGQLFRRLGARVTIVQNGPKLLAAEDDDVADAVTEILRQDGIEVMLKTKTESVSQANGRTELRVRSGENVQTLEGSHLLIATGRVPNSEALNVAAAGIATDKRGFIAVNDKLETNVAGVYAMGDINGGPAFTHISYDDFRILRSNIIEKKEASTKGRLVPYTVFIDPQFGRVGMSETETRQKGLNVRVAKMPMSFVARALEVDESRGFMKAIVDADSGEILGAAVLGMEGGEIMAQLEIAMMGKLHYSVLQNAIFAHPTLAESLNNLFNHFQTNPARAPSV